MPDLEIPATQDCDDEDMEAEDSGGEEDDDAESEVSHARMDDSEVASQVDGCDGGDDVREPDGELCGSPVYSPVDDDNEECPREVVPAMSSKGDVTLDKHAIVTISDDDATPKKKALIDDDPEESVALFEAKLQKLKSQLALTRKKKCAERLYHD